MTIQEELYKIFFVGDRVSNKDVREILQRLYNKYQINSKAQATHLKLFGFKTKRAILINGDKRTEGIKILA